MSTFLTVYAALGFAAGILCLINMKDNQIKVHIKNHKYIHLCMACIAATGFLAVAAIGWLPFTLYHLYKGFKATGNNH